MLFKCAPTWQRIVVAVARPVCDMLSAALYFLSGNTTLGKAILRAYRDFLDAHGELNKKRQTIRSARKAESRQIYSGSIVLRYALGRKTFDDMMK